MGIRFAHDGRRLAGIHDARNKFQSALEVVALI